MVKHHIFSAIFNWILFIFAGNKDKHKSLDEFEIRPDATNGFHGNRKGYSGKNGVIKSSRTFLIGFISYLQVTMIYSRVTFMAQLKVGWQPKYYIECYIPKCWPYPVVFRICQEQVTIVGAG